ncbi:MULTISPECIES: transcriptional regulator [unclassified Microcoleus]|uniref:transcriptional regulator n=1 Tax=unclassified Microcoleus TaxID=2642155 RepID=UPI002FD45A60
MSIEYLCLKYDLLVEWTVDRAYERNCRSTAIKLWKYNQRNSMKMPTSDSYRESLIESLKDAEHAGGFIGAILEEKDPEPALLRNAIRKVIEAKIRMNALSDSAKEHHEKLDNILTESGGLEIYCLVELLEALGFKLEITVADTELPADSKSTDFGESELSPEPANF